MRKIFIDLTTRINLNYIIGFHNEIRNLLRLKYAGLESQLKKEDLSTDTKREIKRQLQDCKHYDDSLAVNTFLMFYSHTEECLYHLCKDVSEKPSSSGSISRFKKPLQSLCVDLSAGVWQLLKDAEVLRGCLLHANGRISLCKNVEDVKRLIKKYKPKLDISSDRVKIDHSFLDYFAGEIDAFVTSTLKKA